jgi:ATP-dependent DNA helicase RecG
MDLLQGSLQFLKGVGPRRAADLQRAGLATVEDLLYRFPTRYEDRGHFQTIASLRPGVEASVAAEVITSGIRPTRRPRFKIFEMLVRDQTGSLRAIWFNQPFLKDVFHPHQRVILFGKLELTSHGLQMQGPQYEIIEGIEGREGIEGTVEGVEGIEGTVEGVEGVEGSGEAETVHTGRIVPIYEKTGQLTAKMQRTLVHQALEPLPAELPDPIPLAVRRRQDLMDRREALQHVHFPPADASVADLNAFRTPAHRRLIFEEFFLFQLGIVLRRRRADSERKGRAVVVTDRTREAVRQVLPFKLTGDQKTVIREIVTDMQRPQPMNRLLQGDVGSGKTIIALMAALVAMENGLQVAFMAPTEILAEQHFFNIRRLLEKSRFRLTLLTGGTPAKKRREILAELSGGSIQMVIGTHALVQEDVAFHELGLAIIDEQHRFGVLQRATLRAKGLHPDVLVMTATPIPRTLALTTYGDLDVSVMREMPPGRQPIATTARPESRRDEMYAFVRGEFDILVSTTVIEVGVDVPNATVMVVEHAERFGLSQLHQLRGRVGRGAHKSYCVLLYQYPITDQGKERLKALTDTTDGFEIAERDLQLRGPGDFFGTRQSGMPTLRVGDLLRDHALMEEARREAVAALDDPDQAATLTSLVNTGWEQRFGLVGIG